MKKNLNWFLRKWTLGFGVRQLFPTTITGVENLPTSPFILIVTPHKSTKETFIVPGFLYKHEFAILVKSGAFKWFSRDIMKASGLIPVERQKGRGMLSFPTAVAALDEGRNMLIFPEGTRHRDDTFMHNAKPGFIYIALASGALVVFARLKNMQYSNKQLKLINAQRVKEGQAPLRREMIIDAPINVKDEIGRLGYAVIGTRVESVVARVVTDRLMRRAADLSGIKYIGGSEKGKDKSD